MFLRHYTRQILVARLPKLLDHPDWQWRRKAPWTSPWRIVTIGDTTQRVREASIATRLR